MTDVGSNEGDAFTSGVDALGGVSRSPGSTYRNLGFSMSLHVRRRLTGSRCIAFDCGRIFFTVLKGQIERPYFFGTIELVSGAATMVS